VFAGFPALGGGPDLCTDHPDFALPPASPRLFPDGPSGFRIGTLTGLLAAYVSAFGVACWQIFQRYSLHQGQWMDQQYSAVIRQSIEASGRMTHNDPSGVEQTRMMLDFALAPNGRATYALFSMVALASGIVLLAGLGGVLGARLTRRSTQQIGQQ
jgi:hypothetical protein